MKEGCRDDRPKRMNVTVEKQDVEIDGMPIRYLAAGEGPPVVLLHGAGDNALDWRWVMPALAASHRVYAPDLPGSPDSARPAADYSPAFFERFATAFLNALDIGRATFVGNSLGGLIALQLALSEPERAGALVLVDSAGLGRAVNPAFTSVNVPGLGEAALPFWRTPVGAYQRAWGRTALLFAHPPRKCPARVVGRTVQAGALAGLFRSPLDRAPRLSGPCRTTRGASGSAPLLKIPTLVVWGARDRVFPQSQAKEAVAQLPEGSLTLVPECGHMPHVECPDLFLAALDDFLGERGRR
jgi:pimeloyl-ACP methyl ester carboxylesterase